jgi:hypothetical protein
LYSKNKTFPFSCQEIATLHSPGNKKEFGVLREFLGVLLFQKEKKKNKDVLATRFLLVMKSLTKFAGTSLLESVFLFSFSF